MYAINVSFLDDHILVLIPTVCIQLLDVGLNHEPSSHVTLRDQFDGIETYRMCFTPIINCGNHAILNLTTLDVLDLTISVRQLKEAFQAIEAVENKLSIIHYLLVHVKDLDSVVDVSKLRKYFKNSPKFQSLFVYIAFIDTNRGAYRFKFTTYI